MSVTFSKLPARSRNSPMWSASSAHGGSGQRMPSRVGLSMEFSNAEPYRGYNEYPEHTTFDQERWPTKVAEFLKFDYSPWRVDAV